MPDQKTPHPASPPVTIGEKLGLEMEMVTATRESGRSHPVGPYFHGLACRKRRRGEAVRMVELDGRPIAVQGAHGDSGLDNGYNLLETAFAPVTGDTDGLQRLSDVVFRELEDAQAALAEEGALLLNASEHPACGLDLEWYRQVRAPRPIYTELVDHRRWLHRVGIDAKAQNSPCTAVPPSSAVRALNLVLALAPAFIALFANSPLEAGRETGRKENRLLMWDRMFRHSRFAGDHYLQRLPEQPFFDLGDYFRWMFGPGTVSRALPPAMGLGYKCAQPLYLADAPSLSTFLASEAWPAIDSVTGESRSLVPRGGHFVYSQFAQFLDARWRYRLAKEPRLEELLLAWKRPGGLEELFERLGADSYIEGRAPGAALPDRQLHDSAGAAIARGVPLAPSALQLGLLRNLRQSEDLVHEWGWNRLRGLRPVAIRDALGNDHVHALARETLSVAEAGLDSGDRHWLNYPRYCLIERETGADRMLALWRTQNDCSKGLRLLACQRALMF